MKKLLITWFAVTDICQADSSLTSLSFAPLDIDVSDDGLTVAGSVENEGPSAARWTSSGGRVGVGAYFSESHGISADGSTIVGNQIDFHDPMSDFHSTPEAASWTGGVATRLGVLSGGRYSSTATEVSADGSIIVGHSSSANVTGTYGTEAFRWTESGGMVGLGDLSGGSFGSAATSISADGSIIVGRGSSINGNEAFRWTESGGMVGLGYLPGGSFSTATSISADGSVIVGQGNSINGTEAFRWTESEGMVGLGFGTASCISADGSTIVGDGFVWDEVYGLQSLTEVLSAHGVNTEGWALEAISVSADGKTIVGKDTATYRTFIAVIPEPSSIAMIGVFGGGILFIRRIFML